MSEKSKGFSISGTAGNGALASVGTVETYGKMPIISFTVKNTHATQALSVFAIQAQNGPGGSWSTLVSGTDFDTMSNFGDNDRIGLSNTTQASIRILPAGEHCACVMFIGPVYAVRFMAQDAGGGIATAEINGHAAGM